ncbi:Rv3235 family protein [soil metagenome]
MTVPQNSVVTRVVEYEPPLKAPPGTGPNPVAAPLARPRHLHAVPGPGHLSPRHRAAAAFADAVLRTVLEVLDRRRPGNQLRPLMIGGLADTVMALRHADGPGQRRAAAVLRRVRLQPVGPGEEAFEVTAAYTRAPRLHALACRVELVSTARGTRWQVTALHIG